MIRERREKSEVLLRLRKRRVMNIERGRRVVSVYREGREGREGMRRMWRRWVRVVGEEGI